MILKKGNLNIAASITDTTPQSRIDAAKGEGLTIVELRVDLCEDQSPETLIKILDAQSLPTILTIRTKEEGGKWTAPEFERYKRFKALIPYADIIDIEA